MNEVSKLIDRTITEVEFDNTITSIGFGAFYDCTGLTSVTIPSWITSIGNYGFYQNSNLTTLVLNEGLVSIGTWAFTRCYALSSLTLPSTLDSIGDYAFSECNTLASITCLATTPPVIGSMTLNGTNKCPIYVPVDSVSAYKAATNWSRYSSRIQGIPFLKAVYTDNNDIEHEVWGGDRTLARSEWGSDYGNVLENMKSCEVKTGVTTIGSNCFCNSTNGCPSLTSITLPDTVTQISNNAFYNCFELTDLNIPSGVTTIDSYAFDGCAKLATDLSFIDGTGVTRLNNFVFAEMFYNDNGTYKGLTTANIPEGITTIYDNAFYRSLCITSISIPSTVTSISSYALKTSYDYDNLVSMTVDANNATYDSRNNCNAVIHTSTNTLVAGCKTTVIPNTVTSIGSAAFRDVALTSITIPDSVTSIGSNAFYTSTLQNVTVQSTVPATITSGVFNTTNLSAIIVPTGTLSAYETAWSDYKDFLFENGVAKWVEQSYTCEVDATDTKTGMITVTEKDANPTSSTYNQTRTRTYEDLTRCNPTPCFSKITSLSDATSGTYIVVYDNGDGTGLALNASLIKNTGSTTTGINANNNFINVSISDGNVSLSDVDTSTTAFDYDGNYISWTDPDTGTTYKLCGRSTGTTFEFSNPSHQVQPASTTYGFSFRDYLNNRLIALYTSGTTHKFRWDNSNSATLNGVGIYKLN